MPPKAILPGRQLIQAPWACRQMPLPRANRTIPRARFGTAGLPSRVTWPAAIRTGVSMRSKLEVFTIALAPGFQPIGDLAFEIGPVLGRDRARRTGAIRAPPASVVCEKSSYQNPTE